MPAALSLSSALNPSQLNEAASQTPPLLTFRDKRVLVTGGISGIGWAISQAYATMGAYVTILDRNPSLLFERCEFLKTQGYHVRGSVCDITCWPQIANVFRESTRFGPPGVAPGLDHVVASAGIMGLPNFPPASSEVPSADDVPDQPSTTALEVNTKGALYITRLAQYYMSIPAPASTSPCDKSIILISSTGAYWPIPYADDYNASKGAVRALFQTLRGPFAGRGIRLNMIAPWLIRTPLSKDGISVLESAGYPICEPEVVVRAAMHLAADPTIVGRALQAGLCGVRDLRDDAEGLHGGLATKALIEEGLGGYEKLELIDASIVKGWGY